IIFKFKQGNFIIFLYPVINKVPEKIRILKGRAKVTALSSFARKSARASSLKSKLDIRVFEKDRTGVPKPLNNIYWSVSHKLDFVAGIVAQKKVGIDIECIKIDRNISDTLFEKIVDADEQLVLKGYNKPIAFFRAFTAKEAVLKQTGDGIKGLSKTKIKTIIDDDNLIVEYLNKKYLVENFYFDNYLAAVTKDGFNVKWTLDYN
ncbi:MAG: 4'-phosphopantetheinyl transferase superfamily protein, partial [Thermodesulfobacteriota bacterium]